MTRTHAMLTTCLTTILTVGAASSVWASHFRGGAMVPSVNASGLLTLNSTTFWRPSAPAGIDESGNPFVTGVGAMVDVGVPTNDVSDARFTKVTQVHTIQLPGAGTYQISASSCCRVAGINNAFEDDWVMDSTIVWDGATPANPIAFNFSAIQPEVVRGLDYVGNLGAVPGPGVTLSYDQALNTSIFSQPPGFAINSATGDLAIPAASTATLLDNPTANVGADYAFSGNIVASDGSSVEFDWLFDAVDTASNLAPTVDEGLIIVEQGDLVSFTATASDPDMDPLDFSLAAFLGTGANLAPTFNPLTQLFEWDTTGSAIGTYIAQIQASDGFLTDLGSIVIQVIAEFDPFGGLIITPKRDLKLTLIRPNPQTDGVRCVETDPNDPDFGATPFTPFLSGQLEIELELSLGDGTKTVCCQFITTAGVISPPLCSEIELATGGPTPTASPTPGAPGALCGPVPMMGCREQTQSHRGQLRLRDHLVDRRDQLRWAWVKGETTTAADYGDPVATDDYALCIYGAGPTLIFDAHASAGGICPSATAAGRPCWEHASAGARILRYSDRGRTPDGLDRIVLKVGEEGKARIFLKGRGTNLAMPALPLALPVIVQLQGAHGECWEATYSTTGASRNDASQFKGRAD